MKLKYNKTKTRFVIVLILYAFTPYFLDLTCSAQDELPTEVVYEMKRQLLKRIAMKRANGILKYYFPDKENTRAVAPEVINVNTFCFGFLPDFLEIELQKSKLNGILGDEYVLYEAQFSRQNANNKNINQWTAFQVDNFFFRQIGLLALKGNKEVILLSSYGGGLTPSCRAILESRPKGCDGFLMYRKIRILKQKEGMSARIVKQDGGKVTIEIDMELNGSMLSQEEAIQLALNEAGKLATRAAAERFDTDGTAITHKGQRLSSKGRKKS